MVNNERSWCMLQHVASMATLTHIDVSVDEKVGDRIMLELLAEEEGEKNAASNQKSKKAKKKARQKAKKAAAVPGPNAGVWGRSPPKNGPNTCN